MLKESVASLNITTDGVYVDMTFGGGGHSREILNSLGDSGQLYSVDQDLDAEQNALEDSRFHFIHQNFSEATAHLMAIGVSDVNGILADLGVSSFQLDDDNSGFSYRSDINLDMRMNENSPIKASDILNTYSQKKLQDIFQEYGEVRNARTLAGRIVENRSQIQYQKSDDLNQVIREVMIGQFEAYAAPVYQALRMEVNDEIGCLKKMLTSLDDIMISGGRVAIISFHSLEDKIVKNFMKYGLTEGEPEVDIMGNKLTNWNWKVLTKKPIVPSEEEVKQNPRSRSAKLRVMEKL